MTDFKATTEHWAEVEAQVKDYPYATETCVLELRARLEALEAAVKVDQSTLEYDVQAGYAAAQRAFAKEREKRESLVERVTEVITETPSNYKDWRNEARAAIREVAAWLREQKTVDRPDHTQWAAARAAEMLEQEAER